MKNCKNCDYYVNNYGYGQCYAQKNAPRVENNECCENWREYSENKEQRKRDNSMIEEVKRLRKENAKLRKRNEELRKRVEDLYDMLCCEDDD